MNDIIHNYTLHNEIDISRHIKNGYQVNAFSFFDNDIYVLVGKKKELNIFVKKLKKNFEELYDYLILKIDEHNNLLDTIVIKDKYKAMHKVVKLRNGNFLLLNCRCRYTYPDIIEKNAKIVDNNGEMINEFTLGDGIEDIIEDANENLWVSYCDEGIFGNYGWGSEYEGKYIAPIGQNGVICWNLNGEKLWEYPVKDLGSQMYDCYAMNIDENNNIWIYYYGEFDLIKIDSNMNLSRFSFNIAGATGFAIYENNILISGGYNKDYYVLCNLEEGEVKEIDKYQFKTKETCYQK